MLNFTLCRSTLSVAVWGVLFASSGFALAEPLVAPASSSLASSAVGVVDSVRIEGNQRIEGSTIISYLGLKTGGKFNQVDIDNSLKNLYATGFFSDVKLLRSGNGLVVRVVENPVISKVVFEGNSRVDTADLEKEIELKARSVYSQEKVQADVKRILDIYRRGGRYNAVVEPKIIKKDQNRVDLVYEVSEGAVASVEKIIFIGNKEFSSRDLQKIIRTDESRWYKFFTDSDKYDSERLQFDQELLRRYYLNEGYIDFQVKSAHAELSPKKDNFFITFVVDEGVQYSFGDVKIVSELKDGEKPDFSDIITTKTGGIYDASKVEETIDAMTKRLGDSGYAFVDIQPKLERDSAKKLATVTYIIKPGSRVYVERINVTGNVRTLDEVIRREFRLSEGDAYNSTKLQRSEQRINNLNFFEKVDVKTEQGSTPDKTVVNVNVKEKSTGEVTLGAGYSSTDGVLGDFGVGEKNLLGRGQELKTHFTLAARRKQAEIGFTEPYFMDRELAAGFDIYRTMQDLTQQSSYSMDSKGFVLRGSYSLQEKLEHGFDYSLRENNVTDVASTASRYIQDQAGVNVNSSIGQYFTYDERNNRNDPSKGYYVRFSQELAGLGGDSHYLKDDVKAGYYYPIS
jgi:outer membrane protein insertion porin family